MTSPLTAWDLASRQIFSIAPEATIQDAAAALHRYRINALPLIQAGSVVGLLSRREIDDAIFHGLAAAPAAAISAGPPPVVAPGTPLPALLALTRRHRLLVVGSLSSPLGVITRTALHRALLDDHAAQGLWDRVEAHLGPLAEQLAALGGLAAERGEQALMIGGCVRDLLREHTPNDIDVVIAGDAASLAREAARVLGGSASVHPAFGTAHWVLESGVEIDLASARTEYYATPGALPTVVTPGDLRQDLCRRDFTINMMAISLRPVDRGRLVDPYDGRADLTAGVLRVVHGLSFLDDPTRFFRAARFAARLDLTLAAGTATLLTEALQAGVSITQQRIGAELSRIFSEATAVAAVRLLCDWGVLGWIAPVLAADAALAERLAACHAAWRALADTDGVETSPIEAMWLALACGLDAASREALTGLVAGQRGRRGRWLHGPDRIAQARSALEGSQAHSAQAAAVRGLDPAELVVLGALGETAAISWWLRTGRHIPLPVDGRLLKDHGARPGPRMGAAIAAARAVAWDGGEEDLQLAAAQQILAED